MTTKRKPMFSIQWHLTTDCLNQCKHCYMERNNRFLSLQECKKIVDDFRSLITSWDCRGRILFTGGDPFLYPYFFELLSYTQKTIPELTIGILGNPESLTGDVISKLKDIGLCSYQVSIDGLEKTHDSIRYKGSFKVTLEKIGELKKARIKTVVMTTVSRDNFKEMPAVVDFVVKEGIDLFGFHRLVPIGNASKMKDDLIPSDAYRILLSEIDLQCQNFADCETVFGGGEPLWKLLHFEKGLPLRKKTRNDNLVWGGCSIGCSGISILEDGTALACRRLQIPIGKLPEQKIRNIFLFSKELNKMRRIKKLEKCGNCELLLYCRGCRAIAYAVYGDYFKIDPQCWKNN